jgi:single-stranded DNA-binding protein
MNNCSFLGKLKEPVFSTTSNDVDLVNFVLEVEEYRKNKSGQKTRRVENLTFEAWHTAAITLKEKLNVGDLVLVECTARSKRDEDDFCYFRVNSFKIFNKERYSTQSED